MDSTRIDWKALERLRRAFLDGTAGAADYWRSESDVESYDATFAQRIGWKWDYVLAELTARGWTPPKEGLVDWGCGSGIASRAFLDHFGATSITGLAASDRSSLAVNYASRVAREKYPSLKVSPGVPVAPGILLLSHVLTELSPAQIEEVVEMAGRATVTIWVEPGTYEASLTLIAIREKLRGTLNLIAPCPHGAQCGILAPGNERHWCHHFAKPPPEIFIDQGWSRFATMTGVDLRSLPLSFLVLDRRPAPVPTPGTVRVLGRPRIYKAFALIQACDASGVRENRLTKRILPDEFRRLKKGDIDRLPVWTIDGPEITSVQTAEP